MILTDTHTHLYVEQFDLDRDAMISRALNAGISRFFVPAIDSTYTSAMHQLKSNHPEHVHLMMGLHPTHVKDNYQLELEHVKTQLEEHDFVAVGEIGIDLYWDKSTLNAQQDAFIYQIQLAKMHNLPIVIHCREAFDEIFDILEDEATEDLRGIFHCFTGNLTQAQQAISYNMTLGIGGVVTFKNGRIDQFLNQIPIEHIVLETDAPYLSPTPFRGKRNESAYLTHVLDKVAEIYGLDQNTVAEITTENSKSIFNI